MSDAPNENDLSRGNTKDTSQRSSNAAEHNRDDLSARDVFFFFSRNRTLVLVTTIFGALIALICALIVTPSFTATATLLPVTDTSNGLGAEGKAAGLGAIASFAGISIGSNSAMREEAIATLKSRILTETFVKQNSLLPILFSSKWDSKERHWKESGSNYVPTLWNANRLFKKKIQKVSYDPKTGLITLAITWTNASQAAQWANNLVALTNSYLKNKAIARAQREIDYLNTQLSKTNLLSVRNGISDLLDSEIRKEMIAKGRHDFALRVIDPAAVPLLPSSPKTTLWIIGGALGGLLLGIIISASKEIIE